MRAEILPVSGHEEMGIVPVTSGKIGGIESLVVNARDLHRFLGISRDFVTWIKDRIDCYGFEDGVDYSIFATPPTRGSGNRGAKTEYFLSMDMGVSAD